MFSVSPILAPLIGSLLIDSLGWRSVFWAVTAIAIGVRLSLTFALPETRPAARRVESSMRGALAAYGVLLNDWRFLGLVFPSSAVLATDPRGALAGTASALMGTLQLLVGACVMALIGQFATASARPIVLGIATCAIAALVVTWLTLGTQDAQPHNTTEAPP